MILRFKGRDYSRAPRPIVRRALQAWLCCNHCTNAQSTTTLGEVEAETPKLNANFQDQI